MINKLKNNNKGGADLQFAIATFLLMFIVCMGLLMDFWYVSSAKIAVLKAVQASELYCLVTNAPKEGDSGGDNESGNTYTNMLNTNLESNQQRAVACTGPELNSKLDGLPYLKDTVIEPLYPRGLSNPVGQMGVTVKMKYKVKTMIRSPGQIFNFMRGETDPELDAINWVPLTVTSKLVPIISDEY